MKTFFYLKAERIAIQNMYKYKLERYKIAEKKIIEKYSEKVVILSFPSFSYFNL